MGLVYWVVVGLVAGRLAGQVMKAVSSEDGCSDPWHLA